jgi:hypothetical protein
MKFTVIFLSLLIDVLKLKKLLASGNPDYRNGAMLMGLGTETRQQANPTGFNWLSEFSTNNPTQDGVVVSLDYIRLKAFKITYFDS